MLSEREASVENNPVIKSGPESLWPLAAALAAPVALWLVLFLAVPPHRQNFPLNDDWCYALGAFGFFRGDGVDYYNWAAAPQLSQWVWAAPFVWAFGETHVALRLSTMTLALIGAFAFYDLLRTVADMSPKHAAFATAALLLNPLFFLLATTYMTDVPSLSLSLISLAFYARALKRDHLGSLLGGAAFAVIAALNRQNTLAAPAAMGVLVLLRYPKRLLRPTWLTGLLLPALIGLLMHVWFNRRPDTVQFWPQFTGVPRGLALAWVATLYVGLSSLPLLAWRLGRIPWRPFTLTLVCVILVTGTYLALHARELKAQATEKDPFHWTQAVQDIPYLGNMLSPFGVMAGPVVMEGRPPALFDFRLLAVVGLIGFAAGAVAWLRLLSALRCHALDSPFFFFALFHLPLMYIAWSAFDRYLLVFVPVTLYLMALPRQNGLADSTHRIRGLTMLVVLAVISLGMMHDWLSWNAARWAVGHRALEHGIPAAQIHGGFEFNAWHSLHKLPLDPPYADRPYAIVADRPQGWKCLDQEPYQLWFPPRRGAYYLLQQDHERVTLDRPKAEHYPNGPLQQPPQFP